MVLNSVLKVVSSSTSLLIRYKKVREGCVYLSKMHSSDSSSGAKSSFPRSSVVDSLLTRGMLKTTRADLR